MRISLMDCRGKKVIEENVLQNLSYFNLISLIRYGRLNNDEISQVKQVAQAKPIHEKELFKLIHRKENLINLKTRSRT